MGKEQGVKISLKCLCETHQCPIIISSKPRQRRRRRDQAASVIARRPLIAAAGDVRTAPRLGCCCRSGGNGGSGGNTAGSTAQTSHFSFFFSLLASRSLCVQKFCLVRYRFTLFPLSCSFISFPVSLHPSFQLILCSSVAHPPSFSSFFFLSPSSLHSSLISLAGAPVLISPSSHVYSQP
jgi:hypothetical protein